MTRDEVARMLIENDLMVDTSVVEKEQELVR
jgi:hypothetical protein